MNSPPRANETIWMHTVTTASDLGASERPLAPDAEKPGGRGKRT